MVFPPFGVRVALASVGPKREAKMTHLRSLAVVLLLSWAAGCASPDTSRAGGSGGGNGNGNGGQAAGKGGAKGVGGGSAGCDGFFRFTVGHGTGGTTAGPAGAAAHG